MGVAAEGVESASTASCGRSSNSRGHVDEELIYPRVKRYKQLTRLTNGKLRHRFIESTVKTSEALA